MASTPIQNSGGAAAAGGMRFEAEVGALLAAHSLTEWQLEADWGFAGEVPKAIYFETSAPVDDILVELPTGRRLFIQVKTRPVLSARPGSDLASFFDQAVRLATVAKQGSKESNPYFGVSPDNSRIVLVVRTEAASSVRSDLRAVLLKAENSDDVQRLRTLLSNQGESSALDIARAHIEEAFKKATGQIPSDIDVLDVLRFTRVVALSVESGGADRRTAVAQLQTLLAERSQADAAFECLLSQSLEWMSTRSGAATAHWRRQLGKAGIALKSAPSYADDVAQLFNFSEDVLSRLQAHENIETAGRLVSVPRECVSSIVEGARDGHLLIIGEPGAGKSGAMAMAAEQLKGPTKAVIALAVDELAIADLDGLRTFVGVRHPIVNVLANMPDVEGGFLLVDALDASRGGPSEQVIIALITQVMRDLPNWKVVATVREFDLRLGKRFQNAFKGRPPSREAFSAEFSNVRHVHVKPWSDNELEVLCSQSQELAAVFLGATALLRDLLRVPFNTRLVAELLDSRIPALAFQTVEGQIGLLDLYWQERIQHLGPGADAVASAAVKSMANSRRLYCVASDIAAFADYQKVLQVHLLVAVRGGDFLGFRHHLLFDYAASRYLVNPENDSEFAYWTHHDREAGLRLGPACSFSLTKLWQSDRQDRSQFWATCLSLAGSKSVDPIIRSIAGKAGALLPTNVADIEALVTRLLSGLSPDDERAVTTIVSSLASLPPEDSPREPWIALATALLSFGRTFIYQSRSLIMWALRQEEARSDIAVGLGARRLLEVGIAEDSSSRQIIDPAIEAVSKTYSTDTSASRLTLSLVLDPLRMNARAHEETPWLCMQAATLIEADPEFAVDVYRAVYAHEVTDNQETSMGDSQILPLRSNKRQDYQMSRWSLGEAFPQYLERSPQHACTALVAALAGYIPRNHPIPNGAEKFVIQISTGTYELQEDQSYIWASDPNDEHAQDGEKLVQMYVRFLRNCPKNVARNVVTHLLPQLSHAVLWARTIMVAAERFDDLGDLMLPFAVHSTFLHCNDTKKDAIDLIGEHLATVSDELRKPILADIAAQDYSNYKNPDDARAGIERRINAVVQRRLGVEPPPESEDANPNRRLFRTWSSHGDPDDDEWWWISKQGVDPKAEPNASLLLNARSLSAKLEATKNDTGKETIQNVAEEMEALFLKRKENASAAEPVRDYVDDALARAGERVIDFPNVIEAPTLLAAARAVVEFAATSNNPAPTVSDKDAGDEHIMWSSPAPRLEAAQALINLARLPTQLDDRLRESIQSLLRDGNAPVREQVAVRLTYLWETDRDLMWTLAEKFAAEEPHGAVMRFFVNGFLGRTANVATERVDAIVETIDQREGAKSPIWNEGLRKEIAQLTGWLWVGHGAKFARSRIDRWLENFKASSDQLVDILVTLRGELVIGLGEQDERKNEIRHRTLALARELALVACQHLDSFLSKSSDSDPETARSAAKLLDTVCLELLFAFSPRNELQQRQSSLPANMFLDETHELLEILAKYGTPHTTHHLLEILESLIDFAPERVWDLIATALLTGGQTHGYAAESLGADLFVRLVGRYLADHKAIFEAPERRRLLVETLDIFIEVGWPAARKLLNDLPDLLR